jgi:hypothetical protein
MKKLLRRWDFLEKVYRLKALLGKILGKSKRAKDLQPSSKFKAAVGKFKVFVIFSCFSAA